MSSTVSRIRGSLLTGGSLRGVGAIMAGTGGAQLIVIAAQPILTRLYAPADYGVFGIAQALLMIVGAVLTLRYEYAIPIAGDDGAAANLFALSLGTALAVTAASTVLLIVMLPTFATDTADLGPYVPMLAITLFAGGIVQAFTGLATRQKAYFAIAQNRFTVSIGTLATQVILGWQGWGAAGLITGLAGGSIAGSIRYAVRDFWSSLSMLHLVSRAGIIAVARRYRRFPILSAPSALLNALGLQLPLLLFVALYGAEEGGLFALAVRVIGFPVVLVALAVGHTYHADAAHAVRENPLDVRDVFLRTTKTLALIASVPTVLAIVLSPLLFGTIFGDEWAEAGLYVSILAPMYYLLSIFSPTGSTLDVLERQELHLVREIFRILLMGGAVVAAASADLPAIATVVAVSVAGCVAYVCYGAISWRAIVSAERKLAAQKQTAR
jgi:O-antigen/teichoic acid export membrane protein